MAIVKEIMLGATRIVFHDDYCKNRTQEEIDAILKDYARLALPELRAAHLRKEKAG